jgi:hypothetical protein
MTLRVYVSETQLSKKIKVNKLKLILRTKWNLIRNSFLDCLFSRIYTKKRKKNEESGVCKNKCEKMTEV